MAVEKFDSKLQDIFRKDMRELSKELLRTGGIKVRKSEEVEFLRGIDSFPNLEGLVLTTGKDEAHVAAISDKEEPVIVWWWLGLGKVIAFTGGLGGEWAKPWLEWDSLDKLLIQALQWSGTQRSNPDFRLSAGVDGLTVKANVLARKGETFQDGLKLKAVFSCPDARETDLRQIGPGEYETQAPGRPDSLCAVTVYNLAGEVLASTEVWVAGSLESGPLGLDISALSKIALHTGGKILSEEEFLADLPEGRGGKGYDLWWLLLILAGSFFLADIALASIFSARRLR